MENLGLPFPPHRCLSSPKAELVSSELGGDSHLGGLSWRDSAGIRSCPSAKNTGLMTTGRWPLFPCTFSNRSLLEGRNPERARGAATLREGEAGESSASLLPPDSATLGTRRSSSTVFQG